MQVQQLLDRLFEAAMVDSVGGDGCMVFRKAASRKVGRQKRIYERLANCTPAELESIGRNLVATGNFKTRKRYEF